MNPNTFEELMQKVGNPIEYLRNLPTPLNSFPVIPSLYSSFQMEQWAWRNSVALLDQSYQMANLQIRGKGAFDLLNRLGVNSFANFRPGVAKHFVCCDEGGRIIGDTILFYLAPEHLMMVGLSPAMHWVQYNAAKGGDDVTFEMRERLDSPLGGNRVERDFYRFQIQGPKALPLLEKLNGGPIPKIPFFHFDQIRIGQYTCNGLRHSMAGTPGLEIWGPYAETNAVMDTIIGAGQEFGLRLVGGRTYGTVAVESAWIPVPLPAIYTGEAMKPYREWLPARGIEAGLSVSGSMATGNIEDYYVTPYELGYDRYIRFDHDFVGAEALKAMADKPARRKVTFVWHPDDVLKIMGSTLGKGGEEYKMLDIPGNRYATSQYDRVTRDGKTVGQAMYTAYSYNERALLSTGLVDADVQKGETLSLIWGEENGGTRKITVEPHVQTEVRVKVADAPYSEDAKSNERVDWVARS